MYKMSHNTTKPTNDLCAQRRLKSACISVQSDQSFRCPNEETLGPWLPTERNPRPDCADTQDDLSFCWAHILFCWFRRAAIQMFQNARYWNNLICIWAVTWQNQQIGMCAQRRLRSAWASAQSDQSSLSAWRKLRSLATHWAHREDSDQSGRMPRLNWVFAGRTCHFVGFVTMRLFFFSNASFVVGQYKMRYIIRGERG